VQQFPTAVLMRNSWDDYGLKTKFELTIFLSSKEQVKIGDVKILHSGQRLGVTEMPRTFTRLESDYCSLGEGFSYYQTLVGLKKQIHEPLLRGLRDVVFDPSLRIAFEDEPGFQNSLLRSSSAARAIKDASMLFRPNEPPTELRGKLAFSFKTNVGGNNFIVNFSFGEATGLPGRANIVIGYNGTGKTRLLGNLAMVAHESVSRRNRSHLKAYGQLVPEDLTFGSVIAVSYSAFDTFALPGRTRLEVDEQQRKGEVSGYTYCGLRKYIRANDGHDLGLKTLHDMRSTDFEARSYLALGQVSGSSPLLEFSRRWNDSRTTVWAVR